MKDDGANLIHPIQWWPKDRFRDRSIRITTEDEKKEHVDLATIPIPDLEVVCDICNADVDLFPCAVVDAHALCSKCRKLWHISPYDTEYFETKRYAYGLEEPKPGVNFGGRRR